MVDLGYENGKRVRKTAYAATQKEARDRLLTLQDQRRDQAIIRDERMTTGQYLERWLTDAVKPNVRPSTAETYATYTRGHLIPSLGRITLTRLGPQDVQRLINAKLREGLSARTVLHLRAILRRALAQAMRWELLTRNVAALVDPPRVTREEIRPLTPEQARTFLREIHGDRLEALYAVAIACGLRQGEALALMWERVNLDDGTLAVAKTLIRVDGKLQLGEPKTARSRRTIMLPRVAIDALRAQRVRQLEERLLAGSRWADSDLVFTSTIGTPLDRHNVTRQFQRLLARVGLPRQRFHDLRHGCASLLFAQGLTAKDVMEVLGHSQISTTADLYGHMFDERRREIADRMDLALRSGA